MFSRNSFGDFYPINSPLHKINPIIKFMCFLISLVILIGTNSLELHFFSFALILIMMLFSNVPIKFYISSIYSLRFLILILLFLFASLSLSLELCLVLFIKIIIFIEYLNIIIYTTSSSELLYGIERFFNPFNILNFNLKKLSLFIVNTIKFFPLLLTTEYKILKTQASRGIDYNHSDILGKIYAVSNTFKNAFRLTKYKIKSINYVYNLRIFKVNKKRSNLRINYVGFYDFVFLSFHLILLIGYILERGLLNEILSKYFL